MPYSAVISYTPNNIIISLSPIIILCQINPMFDIDQIMLAVNDLPNETYTAAIIDIRVNSNIIIITMAVVGHLDDRD